VIPETSELVYCEAAREDALKILAATSKSRTQLAERLLARGHSEQIVAELLDRFENVGLLDDAGRDDCADPLC
jgi:regulatory protein